MDFNTSDLRMLGAVLLPIVVACILIPNTIKVKGKTYPHPLRYMARHYLREMRPW